jgi:hypothetical protein
LGGHYCDLVQEVLRKAEVVKSAGILGPKISNMPLKN